MEGLLDIADLDGDIDMDVEGDRAIVSVVGATLDELVGDDGAVLEALQELTRLAVHRQTGTRARLMLDIGGYRARRRAELADYGRTVAEEVARTGEPKTLAAMSPFERKVVHDAVAAAGQRSESEGEEPNRRVVVYPAGSDGSRDPRQAGGWPSTSRAVPASPAAARPRCSGPRSTGPRRSPGCWRPAGSSRA